MPFGTPAADSLAEFVELSLCGPQLIKGRFVRIGYRHAQAEREEWDIVFLVAWTRRVLPENAELVVRIFVRS